MIEVRISINKEEVYKEVAQTTSYTGTKMDKDAKAYDRIFTTEADRSQLERFWQESCVAVCETLKEFVKEERTEEGGFILDLSLSTAFEEALLPAIRKELFSYFVMNITGKWYLFSNKEETEEYGSQATGLLEDVRKKIYYRRKPSRPKKI